MPQQTRNLATRILPALCLFVGTMLACLRWNDILAYSIASVAGILLLAAILLPRCYEPVYRLQKQLLQSFVLAFSWTALATVFALVFIPGHILLSLSGKRRMANRRQDTDSCWCELPATISDKARFTRQF